MAIGEGTVLGGDYKLLSPLSAGGMGSVYVAEQLSTGSRRAVKLMHPDLVGDPKLVQRFETEARVASRIASDHIVQVLVAGVDREHDVPFLVMELLEGQTLAERIHERGPMHMLEANELLDQLFHALCAAHEANVVHRDLKPENVFLARSRRAREKFSLKVLDFGIAKLLAAVNTRATEGMGTPLWMAPEQSELKGHVSPATDVWALGLLVFYVLVGKPFWLSARDDGGFQATMREVLFDPLPPASVRARDLGQSFVVPTGFDEVFAKAVNRDPAQRYQTASELRDALEPILTLPMSKRGAGKTVFAMPDEASFERSSLEPLQRGSGTLLLQPVDDAFAGPRIIGADAPPAPQTERAPGIADTEPESRSDVAPATEDEDDDEDDDEAVDEDEHADEDDAVGPDSLAAPQYDADGKRRRRRSADATAPPSEQHPVLVPPPPLQTTTEEPSSLAPWIVLGAIVLTGAVGGLIGISSKQQAAPTQTSPAEDAQRAAPAPTRDGPTEPSVLKVLASHPIRGSKDALVTVVMFNGIECAPCVRMTTDLVKIVDKDPSRVRLVFRHLEPPDRLDAASVARSAFRTGGDLGFYKVLMRLGGPEARLAISTGMERKDALLDVARQDVADLKVLPGAEQEVRVDLKEAEELGVRSAPTVFINGERVTSDATLTDLERIINRHDNDAREMKAGGFTPKQIYAAMVTKNYRSY